MKLSLKRCIVHASSAKKLQHWMFCEFNKIVDDTLRHARVPLLFSSLLIFRYMIESVEILEQI